MSDVVNHPEHYTSRDAKCAHCGGQVECIQIAQTFPFSLGNAIKYLWRAGAKGDAVEDLRKAGKYIEFEIARLEAERDAMRAQLVRDIEAKYAVPQPAAPLPENVIQFPPPGERWHE